MKHGFFIALALLVISCNRQEHSQTNEQLIDSIGQDCYTRELQTGRVFRRDKIPLPNQLHTDSRKQFRDDSVYFSNILLRLKRVDPNQLQGVTRTYYDLLTWNASMRLEATRYFDVTFPSITPYSNNGSGIDFIFTQAALNNEADLTQYLELLKQYSRKQTSDLERLRNMEAHGIRLPKAEIELVLKQIKALQVSASAHPYYVSTNRLQNFDSVKQKSFQQQTEMFLEKEIIPGYAALINYLSGHYLEEAPDAVGLGQYPGGKEYYKYLVRWHTTTELTPEEIHKIGQEQVKNILTKLDSTRKVIGFKGSLHDFYKFLRSDKRFLANSPDEVGERLKGHLRKMDKVVARLISIKPKALSDVRRLPLDLEPAMTFGYYHPPGATDSLGIYFYNGSKLDQRSLVSAASLAFHEITPGHHWQVNLQSESIELPDFRKNVTITAFSEGWGDYAAYLGIELGLYTDPYDYCGRLLMDMFISVRLVVDTGMNYMGWTREEASAFMREHVIESEAQIGTETLRYSCDIQGQSLGYKIGSLRLIELRKKYGIEMGNQFDIIKFHDAILKNGNLPLNVLEKCLDREFGIAVSERK